MRRTILVTVVIGAVVVGAAGWAFGSKDVSAPQTIHGAFVGTETWMQDQGPSGPSIADEQTTSGYFLVNGKRAGVAGFTCWQHHGFTLCGGTGKLYGGQISFQGMSFDNSNRHVWSITGGTQSYDNARGVVQIQDVSPRRSRITLEILP